MKAWVLAVAVLAPCLAHAKPTLLGGESLFHAAAEDGAAPAAATDTGPVLTENDDGPKLGTALFLLYTTEIALAVGITATILGAVTGGILPLVLGVGLDVIGIGTLIGEIIVVQQRKSYNEAHHISMLELSKTVPVFAWRF